MPACGGAGGSPPDTPRSLDSDASTALPVEPPVEDLVRQGLSELLLQAPLAEIFARESEDTAAVMSGIVACLPALEPMVRSRIVSVLVEHREPNFPSQRRQEAAALVHRLFVTCEGEDLLRLKQLVDRAGKGRDLPSVCNALSAALRDSLMEHFASEGLRLETKPIKVLSDIDMTIWVGKYGVGGPKFPKGPIPGALSLFETLSEDITFLSARPPLWEGRTRSALLDNIGIAEARILPGTLRNVARVLVQPEVARQAMGEQKEKVFNEFALLHPEARFVFFGDSGEGDVGFAANFVRGDERVALIHDVVGADGVTPKTSAEQRLSLAEQGVHFFDTYVGAALQLYRLGILEESRLLRAAERCSEEFYELAPESFSSLDVFCAREKELKADLAALSEELVQRPSGLAAVCGETRVLPCGEAGRRRPGG
mmetsp:Transcript_31208/g.82728  ORF Transcript_31208/g.82728 Transcript_31208/m.82728 type:complete len:427 (+) Transcript_31208:2-1282(+)